MQIKLIEDSQTPGYRFFVFSLQGEYYYGRQHLKDGKTFFGSAICSDGRWREGYGGTRVFSALVEPELLYEIAYYATGLAGSARANGRSEAQAEMRRALGL